MNISATVITLNEELNLPRCLESIRPIVDEMVVVDSGSTDRTEEIARRFGARWVVEPWRGYVGQKNLAMDLATHRWILSLDADEAVSPPLAIELNGIKQTPVVDAVSGFSMPRCVHYDGRWIRHGDWYPDRLVRLFRKDRARFAGGRVHERLEVDGSVQPLSNDLFHFSFRDAEDHWARCERYAALWAESQWELGRRASAIDPWTHAGFRWIRGYLLRGGWRDGRQGLRIANLSAREVALKYRLLRQFSSSKRPHPGR